MVDAVFDAIESLLPEPPTHPLRSDPRIPGHLPEAGVGPSRKESRCPVRPPRSSVGEPSSWRGSATSPSQQIAAELGIADSGLRLGAPGRDR